MITETALVVLRRAACAAAVVALAACGRPTGDFGRARPSVIHDDLMPAAGAVLARSREEPVSGFNLTDDERELRDRAFAFVRSPHLGDWWLDTLVEGQRTRILPVIDPDFDTGRYYAYLRADPYRSSDARWSKVIEDVTGDAMLVPPFCAVAARVRTTDAGRIGRLESDPPPDPVFIEDGYARVDENAEVTAWVWRALGYRLAAYRVAIDRLAVETPSSLLWDTNRAWAALSATRCEGGPPLKTFPGPAPRRSRLLDGPDPFDRPVLQK